MNDEKTISTNLLSSEDNPQFLVQSNAIFNSRLEAMTVLSNSLLCELDALKMNDNAVGMGEVDLMREVERFEVGLIRTALLRTGGKQRPAARLLNIKVTTLNAKIKRLDIQINNLHNSVKVVSNNF